MCLSYHDNMAGYKYNPTVYVKCRVCFLANKSLHVMDPFRYEFANVETSVFLSSTSTALNPLSHAFISTINKNASVHESLSDFPESSHQAISGISKKRKSTFESLSSPKRILSEKLPISFKRDIQNGCLVDFFFKYIF